MPIETTTETWSVNGTVLNTIAHGFRSFTGRVSGRSIRGADEVVPGGADVFLPKWGGPRTEQWLMFVRDTDPNTGVSQGRARALSNLESLETLFIGTPGTALALVKKRAAVGGGLITRSASGWCRSFTADDPGAHGTAFFVTAEIVIPSGVWT